MDGKKYRITYNPYKRITKVEEYYSGASNPWRTLGSEKEPELNHILERKESIQKICLELLKWLEEYNDRCLNGKPYEVLFNGIKQDYSEVENIGKVFASREKGCKFTKIIRPEKFWDPPKKIQSELEKICKNIKNIYSDNGKLLQKIEKGFDVIDQNLNILILGMQNSGKSTLINALLGKEILPTSEGVETATLYTIEPGKEDKVIIYLDETHYMEISITNRGIKYNAIENELDSIVSNISQSDDIKDAKDSSEIIRTILKELNAVCRKKQDEDHNILFLKEVRIQIKDFKILGNDERTVCIKDFPGAGSQYLGEEHKIIIREEIENVTNAVAIYVINADNSTYKNVHDNFREIKEIDDRKEGVIGSQIDFARSIYVLNRADDINNLEEKKASVRKDFPNKKVVFCCAQAGVKITARGEKAVIPKDKYGSSYDEDNILNLQEHALLPDEYTESDVCSLTDEMVASLENGELLRNTGLILCGGLIKEYVDNFASVNRTRCYYQAVKNMMEQLKQEEKNQEKDKEHKKKAKEKEQEGVRDSLKKQCERIVENYKSSIKESEIQEKLGCSTREYLDVACDCASGLKKIKKEYKQQNKAIKKANKEKQKVNKVAGLDEKKDWREELGKDIDSTIKKKHSDIKNKVYMLLTQYCGTAKEQMMRNIQATSLMPEEEKEIRRIISEYEVPSLAGDDYKIPEAFEFSFGPSEMGKFIFHHSEWQEDRISDSIRDYWTDEIIDPYSEQLVTNIKQTFDALLKHILERLDDFAPQLINLQKEIDEKESRLADLRLKIAKSNEQSDLCEQIVESGVVNG